MTREEEIYKIAKEYSENEYNEIDASNAFIAGAKWADKHPQFPWISVKEDLPCNHEELLHPLYANFTKDVLVIYENKYISLERMIKDGKGNWEFIGNVHYWMPIPESPKE